MKTKTPVLEYCVARKNGKRAKWAFKFRTPKGDTLIQSAKSFGFQLLAYGIGAFEIFGLARSLPLFKQCLNFCWSANLTFAAQAEHRINSLPAGQSSGGLRRRNPVGRKETIHFTHPFEEGTP